MMPRKSLLNSAALLVCTSVCSLLSGCALTSKSEPWTTRYFSLDSAAAGGETSVTPSHAQNLRLRLGRVSAAAHLRERIAFRSSDHELGYYEDRRWTERPDASLRRGLAFALFEQRGLTRVVSGPSPTLEVELAAFEEIRGKRPRARLRAVLMLHDQKFGRLEQTIDVEQPLEQVGEQERPEAVAAALAQTLQLGITRVAELVQAKLSATPSPERCPCDQPDPAGTSTRAAPE